MDVCTCRVSLNSAHTVGLRVTFIILERELFEYVQANVGERRVELGLGSDEICYCRVTVLENGAFSYDLDKFFKL